VVRSSLQPAEFHITPSGRASRCEPDLLGELAVRGTLRRLAVDVERPSGELDESRTERLAVLLDERDASLSSSIATTATASGCSTTSRVNVPVGTDEHVEPHGREPAVGVLRTRRAEGGHARAHVRERRRAREVELSRRRLVELDGQAPDGSRRWRMAAATSPENSGWGRLGRERSSGCACVATKNGCSGSSRNSTSSPSGDVPDQRIPRLGELSR
jgi:hypothetical protein